MNKIGNSLLEVSYTESELVQVRITIVIGLAIAELCWFIDGLSWFINPNTILHFT